jgi:hypothetical protein
MCFKWGMTSNDPITFFMAMSESILPLLYRTAPVKLRSSLRSHSLKKLNDKELNCSAELKKVK